MKCQKKKNKGGRPSKFTIKLADLICERLSEGESLRSICSDDNMPHRVTVFRWLSYNKRFCDQYARAREAQADAIADEILDIADDSNGDIEYDENGNPRTNQEIVARSRLRVDARKWLAGKLKPKVYGEKIQQEHSGSIESPSLNLHLHGSSLTTKTD